MRLKYLAPPLAMRFAALAALVSFAAPVPVRAADARLAELERRMLSLVNADRASDGLPPLAWDDELRLVARAHSQDMVTNRFFAHDSRTTGSAADRIYKAGIPASATGENLAMDFTIESGEEMLMKSPGHRANILSTDYDRCGIGIVDSGSHLYITQNFRKALAVVDTKMEIQLLFRAMNGIRRENGLPELIAARPLMEIARDVAREQDAEQKLKGSRPGVLLDRRQLAFRKFYTFVGLDKVASSPLAMKQLRDPAVNKVGIALVQNKSQEKGLGMMWIVVLLAAM